MAAIYNGPARGGNRGGKDQFNWEDVKEDKNNQSYLGHSVKAPVGRWQNGKDLQWYTKKSKVDLKAAQEAERREIKLKEQDLMLQMLGEKPMEPAPRADLNRIQKNKLLKKGDAEEGTVAAAISQDDFGERVEGIGYAPIKIDDLRQAMEISTSTRLEGTGINEMIAAHAAGDGGEGHEADDHAALLAAIEGGAMAHHAEGSSDAGEPLSKEEKKERKRLKKEMKKLHKSEKAERKAAKAVKAATKSKSQDPNTRVRASDFFKAEPERESIQLTEKEQRLFAKDSQAADRNLGGESRRYGSEDRPSQRDARGRDGGRPSERSISRGRSRDGKRSRSGERQSDRRHSVSRDRDGRRSRERFDDRQPSRRSRDRHFESRPPFSDRARAGRYSRSRSRDRR